MHYVVDCSFSSALFLPDEKSLLVRDFFLKLEANDTVFVPFLWWYESLNVLNVSVKRKIISYSEAILIKDSLHQLRFVLNTDYDMATSAMLIDLTQLYSISVYDASYLELALRMKAKLMTLDKDIQTAAKKIGLDCFI